MIRAFMCACLLGAVFVAPAAAGKPTMEVIPISDVGLVDGFLSEECGTEVLFDGSGHIILRQFLDADGNLVREVNNFAIRIHYYSDFGDVTAVDVGADLLTVLEDGSELLAIIGNVQSFTQPGEGRVHSDTGRVLLHVTFDENGDPIFEFVSGAGQHTTDGLAALCEVLGP